MDRNEGVVAEDLRPFWAVADGDVEALAALPSAPDVDTNALDEEGHTCLHVAVIHESGRALRPLLERGADPNASDAFGMTPVLRARHLAPS